MIFAFRWTSVLSMLLFGAIVGWLASVIMGRNKRMGCLANILIGVLGSLLAGFLAPILFPRARAVELWGINLYSIGMGVIGAVVLLGITGWYRGRSRR